MTAKRRTDEHSHETQPRSQPEVPRPDVGELQTRIEQLESDAEEAAKRHLRLAADFDNFKKRARQEQLDTIAYASASVVERLLPVLDDFQRALDHAPTGVDEGWLKGLRLTYQKLQDILSAQGVEAIESVGAAFNPNLHEAVGSEESNDHPEDTVVIELRRGYRLRDRVIRPALVAVAEDAAATARASRLGRWLAERVLDVADAVVADVADEVRRPLRGARAAGEPAVGHLGDRAHGVDVDGPVVRHDVLGWALAPELVDGPVARLDVAPGRLALPAHRPDVVLLPVGDVRERVRDRPGRARLGSRDRAGPVGGAQPRDRGVEQLELALRAAGDVLAPVDDLRGRRHRPDRTP
jgi:molecular chaperone GrpE